MESLTARQQVLLGIAISVENQVIGRQIVQADLQVQLQALTHRKLEKDTSSVVQEH